MSQTFLFSQRLHRRDEFERTLKNKALIDRWLALHSEKNSVGSERLGIVVSKRVVAKAVARNRIKRVIREVFRQTPPVDLSALDLVVRIRRSLSNEETVEFRRALSCLLMKTRMANK